MKFSIERLTFSIRRMNFFLKVDIVTSVTSAVFHGWSVVKGITISSNTLNLTVNLSTI